jgi:hypothetical protein
VQTFPEHLKVLKDIGNAGSEGLTLKYLGADADFDLRMSLKQLYDKKLITSTRDKAAGKGFFNFKINGKGRKLLELVRQ